MVLQSYTTWLRGAVPYSRLNEGKTMADSKPLSMWDLLGISASTLCAIHCVLMPFLLGLLPAIASSFPEDETVHSILAFGVAGFAMPAFVMGYRRHHQKAVLALMAVGLCVIFFVSFFGCEVLPSCTWESSIMVLGSAFMITAHYFNGTFCRTCKTCREGRTYHGLSTLP